MKQLKYALLLFISFLLVGCGGGSSGSSNSYTAPTGSEQKTSSEEGVAVPKIDSMSVNKALSRLEMDLDIPNQGTTYLFNVYNQDNELASNIMPNSGIIQATKFQKISLQMTDIVSGVYRISLTNLEGEVVESEWIVE